MSAEHSGSIKIRAFRDQALLQLAVAKVNTVVKDNMLDHLHGVSTTEIQRYFDERRYIPAALVRAVASQVVIEEPIQENIFNEVEDEYSKSLTEAARLLRIYKYSESTLFPTDPPETKFLRDLKRINQHKRNPQVVVSLKDVPLYHARYRHCCSEVPDKFTHYFFLFGSLPSLISLASA